MILLIVFVRKYTLIVDLRVQINVTAELTWFDVCCAFSSNMVTTLLTTEKVPPFLFFSQYNPLISLFFERLPGMLGMTLRAWIVTFHLEETKMTLWKIMCTISTHGLLCILILLACLLVFPPIGSFFRVRKVSWILRLAPSPVPGLPLSNLRYIGPGFMRFRP